MNKFLLPLSDLDKQNFSKGYCIIDNFLSPQQCQDLLGLITEYRNNHKIPEVLRDKAQKDSRSSYLAPLRIDTENLKIWVIKIPDYHGLLSLNQRFWYYTE